MERLLEADPVELAGSADSQLTAHIKVCARCRAVADRFLEEQERLAAALDAREPTLSMDVALERAREAVGASAGSGKRRARERIGWIAPLAAAAALVGVLLWRVAGPESLPDGPALQPRARQAAPLVEPPPDRDVAVFETDDPEITVVWFFEPSS